MITDEQIWAFIADWDWMTEEEREELRRTYPAVRWDLTVDWTRVGDAFRVLQGKTPIIKPA